MADEHLYTYSKKHTDQDIIHFDFLQALHEIKVQLFLRLHSLTLRFCMVFYLEITCTEVTSFSRRAEKRVNEIL